MKHCRFKRCPFHKACSGLAFVCVWAQYLAIGGLGVWLIYLFSR